MAGRPEFEFVSEIKRFSPEARKALEEAGYIIYELTGRSIIDLEIENGEPFDYEMWGRDYPLFMRKTSMRSEVAINPHHVFIEGSNEKTLEEQQLMIAAFSVVLGTEIVGVKAVMGDVADYVELIFAHYHKTGEQLFKEVHGQARTKTSISEKTHIANVGHQGYIPPRLSAAITGGPGRATSDVFAAPLIVPKIQDLSA